jgi:fido (protein-threonine AMPylation protein)
MYESGPDPYCYPGTTVLKNRLGLRRQEELDAFEAMITAQRGEEPLPRGRLGYAHYRAIHRHLFQDVFDWAGKIRTVRIAKGASMFCYPEHIDAEMRRPSARLGVHGTCSHARGDGGRFPCRRNAFGSIDRRIDSVMMRHT